MYFLLNFGASLFISYKERLLIKSQATIFIIVGSSLRVMPFIFTHSTKRKPTLFMNFNAKFALGSPSFFCFLIKLQPI